MKGIFVAANQLEFVLLLVERFMLVERLWHLDDFDANIVGT